MISRSELQNYTNLCPAGHSVQYVVPPLLYVPFSHSIGADAEWGHLDPAGQREQVSAPLTSVYVPFPHGTCVDSPLDGQCDPFGH